MATNEKDVVAKKAEKRKFYLNKSSAKTYTCALDGKQYTIYKIVRGESDELVTWDERERLNKEEGDGGWVSSEANLSQKGKCWIREGAVVCGNARVSGNAKIDRKAVVSGSARVCEDATVGMNAEVGEHAFVGGRAFIQEATVKGRSRVFGTVTKGATIQDSAEVGCDGHVEGKWQIKDFALVRGKLKAKEDGVFVVGGASVVLGEVSASKDCNITGCVIIKEDGSFKTMIRKKMELSECAIIGGSVEDSTVGGLTWVEGGGNVLKSTMTCTGTAEGNVKNATITGATVTRGDVEGGNISGVVYLVGNVKGGEISGAVYSTGSISNTTVTGSLNATASVDGGNVDSNCVADKAGESPSGGNEVVSAKKKLQIRL